MKIKQEQYRRNLSPNLMCALLAMGLILYTATPAVSLIEVVPLEETLAAKAGFRMRGSPINIYGGDRGGRSSRRNRANSYGGMSPSQFLNAMKRNYGRPLKAPRYNSSTPDLKLRVYPYGRRPNRSSGSNIRRQQMMQRQQAIRRQQAIQRRQAVLRQRAAQQRRAQQQRTAQQQRIQRQRAQQQVRNTPSPTRTSSVQSDGSRELGGALTGRDNKNNAEGRMANELDKRGIDNYTVMDDGSAIIRVKDSNGRTRLVDVNMADLKPGGKYENLKNMVNSSNSGSGQSSGQSGNQSGNQSNSVGSAQGQSSAGYANRAQQQQQFAAQLANNFNNPTQGASQGSGQGSGQSGTQTGTSGTSQGQSGSGNAQQQQQFANQLKNSLNQMTGRASQRGAQNSGQSPGQTGTQAGTQAGNQSPGQGGGSGSSQGQPGSGSNQQQQQQQQNIGQVTLPVNVNQVASNQPNQGQNPSPVPGPAVSQNNDPYGELGGAVTGIENKDTPEGRMADFLDRVGVNNYAIRDDGTAIVRVEQSNGRVTFREYKASDFKIPTRPGKVRPPVNNMAQRGGSQGANQGSGQGSGQAGTQTGPGGSSQGQSNTGNTQQQQNQQSSSASNTGAGQGARGGTPSGNSQQTENIERSLDWIKQQNQGPGGNVKPPMSEPPKTGQGSGSGSSQSQSNQGIQEYVKLPNTGGNAKPPKTEGKVNPPNTGQDSGDGTPPSPTPPADGGSGASTGGNNSQTTEDVKLNTGTSGVQFTEEQRRNMINPLEDFEDIKDNTPQPYNQPNAGSVKPLDALGIKPEDLKDMPGSNNDYTDAGPGSKIKRLNRKGLNPDDSDDPKSAKLAKEFKSAKIRDELVQGMADVSNDLYDLNEAIEKAQSWKTGAVDRKPTKEEAGAIEEAADIMRIYGIEPPVMTAYVGSNIPAFFKRLGLIQKTYFFSYAKQTERDMNIYMFKDYNQLKKLEKETTNANP